MDWSTSKYENALAQAASIIAGLGTSEVEGNVEEIDGWNALVEVDVDTLNRIGEPFGALELEREVKGWGYHQFPASGALVWIRENEQGFVSVVMWGHDEGLGSGTDSVRRDWDRFVKTRGPWVTIRYVQSWDQERYENPDAPEWGEWDEIPAYLAQWDFGAETDQAATGEWGSPTTYSEHDVTVDGVDYVLTHSPLGDVSLQRRPMEDL